MITTPVVSRIPLPRTPLRIVPYRAWTAALGSIADRRRAIGRPVMP